MLLFKCHWNSLSLKIVEGQIPRNAHYPKLASEPFYYREISLFWGTVHLKHLKKVKLSFGESEFQWNRFMATTMSLETKY